MRGYTQRVMNKFEKILLIIPISLLTCTISEAQTLKGTKDTIALKEQKESGNKITGKSSSIDNNKEVKQIRSARPDMSRSSGARPPSIVRPSGSGIPHGIGKPGGARGAGRR